LTIRILTIQGNASRRARQQHPIVGNSNEATIMNMNAILNSAATAPGTAADAESVEPGATRLVNDFETWRRLHRNRVAGRLAGNTWALVLAAGEGTRLRSLTTTASGLPIPKQFCSLRAGPSLLEEALQRGNAVAGRDRLCAIVALQHRRWWSSSLAELPSVNVIVQPENRGTANGILLPLLHIMERDPDANMVLLPSDHHVEDETMFAASLRESVEQLEQHPEDVIVLGIEPTVPDPELGYVVPRRPNRRGEKRGSDIVVCFIEKPSTAYARELIRHGSLWNTFILAVKARALLELFMGRAPDMVAEMRDAVRRDISHSADSLATLRLYARLPMLDFSRDIIEGQEAHLRVLHVPDCGWTNLGTPERVGRALLRVAQTGPQKRSFVGSCGTAFLSLAAQYSLHGPRRWLLQRH
jgi:mannose-1-phosphate guanylyltransferase